MARIENKNQKMVRKFREFIKGRMAVMNMPQRIAAKEMFMSQQTFCYKLKNLTFDVSELIALFEILEVEPDELSRLLLGKG